MIDMIDTLGIKLCCYLDERLPRFHRLCCGSGASRSGTPFAAKERLPPRGPAQHGQAEPAEDECRCRRSINDVGRSVRLRYARGTKHHQRGRYIVKIKHNILVAAIAITTSCGNAPCGCGGAPQTPAPHASKPGITATAKLHAPSAAKPSQ